MTTAIADSRTEVLEQWKDPITAAERIHHELLFYSQGPVDGHLSGDAARDLFLHSKLPLTVLSKIWNLADVTNDNVLNVQEFVVAMHLILGIKEGLQIPRTLPKHLVPKAVLPPEISDITDREQLVYQHVFQKLNQDNIDAIQGRLILQESGLSVEELSRVWDLADIDRNGQLDKEEWNIALHLIMAVKQGIKLEGPVNVFRFAPKRLSPTTYQARKNRVEDYSKKKHELMTAKEKRKHQIENESKRLELLKKRLSLHKELFEFSKTASDLNIPEESFLAFKEQEELNIEKVEAIIYRLKKEHESIRQATVKAILGEQGSLQEDAQLIKVEQDKVKVRLIHSHTKATKDPDPFHELYEQRKELRKRSTLSEGEEPEVHWPFTSNPFDKSSLYPPFCGDSIFVSPNPKVFNNNNTHKTSHVIKDLAGFPEDFVDKWIILNSLVDPKSNIDYDPIFMFLNTPMDSKGWCGLPWSEKAGAEKAVQLHQKLQDLKTEMDKLNTDTGGQLIFRNPEDYLAKKKAQEEEDRLEKSKYQRRFHGDRDDKDKAKRRSYIVKSSEDDAHKEFRHKRRSLNLDKKSNKSADLDISKIKSSSARRADRPLSVSTDKPDSFVPDSTSSPKVPEPSKTSPRETTSPRSATSPPRPSTKRKAAPPPPQAAPVVVDEGDNSQQQKSKQEETKSVPVVSNTPIQTQEKIVKPVEDKTKITTEVTATKIPQPASITSNFSQPSRPPRRRKKSEENKSFLHGTFSKEQETNSKNIAVNVDIKAEKAPQEFAVKKTENKVIESVPKSKTKDLYVESKDKKEITTDKVIDEVVIQSVTKSKLETVPTVNGKHAPGDMNEEEYQITPVKTAVPRGKLLSNTGFAIELKEKTEISTNKQDIDSDDEVVTNGTAGQCDSDDNDEISEGDIIQTIAYSKSNKTVDTTFDKLLHLPDKEAYKDTISIASDISISSTGSEAPPLPDSAPPPLAALATPTVTKTPSLSEVTEVVEAAKASVAETTPNMADEVPNLEKASPREISSPIADLKTISMRVTSPSREMTREINGSLTVDVGKKGDKYDSDISDDEDVGKTRTYSPGKQDLKDIPMQTHADDGSAQLISFNPKLHSPNSDQSAPDSAFEDMQSSVNSNDPLSSTLDDIVQEDYVTLEKVEKVESVPKGGIVTNEARKFELALNATNQYKSNNITSPVGNKDFMAKAQQFAETVQKPPKMTVKLKREINSPSDLTDERYLQLEKERRAVINMSTMKKRNIDLTGSQDSTEEKDTQEQQEPLVDSDPENSIQEWRSDVSKRSNIPWEEKPEKVNLYSQNIIQETDNTESVDRESIANLSKARQQWETKLKPSESNSTPVKNTQTAKVRHWEVKLPTPLKQVPADVVKSSNYKSDSDSESENMADTEYANESAIEREIRLATEREELLRREQEERTKLIERQSVTQSSTVIQSSTMINKEQFDGVSEENNNKPTYHEMTEADRGSELQAREEMIQQELLEQQEREAAMRRVPQDEQNSDSSSEEEGNPNESIIEREIRLQQERERELELRRQELLTTSIQSSEPEVSEVIETEQITVEYSEPVCSSPTPVSTPDNLSDVEQQQPPQVPEPRTRMSYEEAIASNSHDGESLIARELREAREREEELARQRQIAIGSKAVATPPVKQEVRVSVKETVANQNKPTYQKDVSPFKNGRRQSQDTLSSHSTDKSSSVPKTPTVRVGAFSEDSYVTPERTEPVQKEKQETPIEREIRLARERENEFRVAKGLPPLKDEKKEEVENTSSDISYSTPKQKTVTASSRQKFASSRLQKEINKQNEIEKKYLDEGKIKSTSEEHVGLIKYTEIASETANSTPKRNFSIPKKSAGVPVIIENGADSKQNASKSQTPEQSTTKFNRSVSSGGVTFSYKESRHKAESKIEQELREMREREDELRKQRAGSGLVSPRDPDSPRSPNTVTNKRSQFEQKS